MEKRIMNWGTEKKISRLAMIEKKKNVLLHHD
jgi:hypothetical protein